MTLASSLPSDGYACSVQWVLLTLHGALYLTSLPLHPFPDVWRTLQDRDANGFAFVQEADAIEINQIDLFQIQGYRFSSTFNF